jgi:hypothetical protein
LLYFRLKQTERTSAPNPAPVVPEGAVVAQG